MGICQNHLEFISASNTINHVSDDTSDGTEDSVSLFLLEPHSEFNGGISFLVTLFYHLERDVFE